MARTDGVWEIIEWVVRPIWPDGYDVLVYWTNRYLNFNILYWSSWYGFRDNWGTMQYKNSGWSWSNIWSGWWSPWWSDTQLQYNNAWSFWGISWATSDGTTVTLVSPTLTTPKFADNWYIADSNWNELLLFNSNASAVNYLELENWATGNPPHLRSKWGDTNIWLHLVGKGTGEVSVCDATDETKRLRFGVSNNWTWIITTLRSNSTWTSKTIDLPDFSGTLATLTWSEILSNKTLSWPTILEENASLQLDWVLSADGKRSWTTITATAWYTQSFGDLVYLDPTDSRREAVDANAAAGADWDARGLIGMVVSAGTDGNACTILLNGTIRADANCPTLTIGWPV